MMFTASFRPHGLAGRPAALLWPAAATAALADWLFWHHPIGLSVALFCAALAGAANVFRPPSSRPEIAMKLAAFIIGLAPSVVDPGPLPFVFAFLSTSFAVGLTRPRLPIEKQSTRAVMACLNGPRQTLDDLSRYRRVRSRRPRPTAKEAWAGKLVWLMPAAAAAVFLALFAEANPVIAEVLAALPMPTIDELPSPLRVTFWIVVVVVVWPMLHPRRGLAQRASLTVPSDGAPFRAMPSKVRVIVFGEAAVLRALTLCIALFVLQLGLDGAYLWGGVGLPDGMTYAEYAHRGAYPLLVTALLAGAFVVFARRIEVIARHPKPLAGLLLVFIGLNVLLVITAIQRLALYIAAYGLTEWRVAAFCWMVLVAFGLTLTGVQVIWRYDNDWLASRCTLAAFATLYVWSLAGIPAFVARYDVAHCSELTGSGPALDTENLLSLGPAALPALDDVRGRLESVNFRRWYVDNIRRSWVIMVARDRDDWRGWSVRTWRLARYVDSVDPGAHDRAGDDQPTP